MRGIAALGVMAFHYKAPWTHYGLLGVELFFVISGFVILMTLEKVNSIAEFAIQRVARLYPAYWLSVAIAGTFLLAIHQTSLRAVVGNATMLQSFLGKAPLINPYWTLSFELWFYVVIASLFAVNQIKNIDMLALCWLLAMTLLRGAMLLVDHDGLLDDWAFNLFFMPLFGHLFIAGMMLYRIRTNRGTPATFAALSIAVIYSLFGRPDWSDVSPIVYFSANTIFLVAVWAVSSGRAVIFSAPLLVSLGARSYSIYLLHVPVLFIFEYFIGHTWSARLVALVLTLAAASMSWMYVERPAQSWARRFASNSRTARREPKAAATMIA